MLSKKEPQEVPARVRAAQEFISACHGVTDPVIFPYVQSAPGRDLNPRERATYDAALSTLRLYFLGEMDYTGDAEPEPEEARGGKSKQKR
jgi:hypothetical protein